MDLNYSLDTDAMNILHLLKEKNSTDWKSGLLSMPEDLKSEGTTNYSDCL
jgi:hypothetical protein